MSNTSAFTKKVIQTPGLAQVSFDVEVLSPYLSQAGTSVARTNTVGRVKTATWSLDFGIAPDEKTIHIAAQTLAQKLPESERAHWFSHSHGSHFSENFLKMQMAHSCIDDGGYRAWGEEEPLF
jgi:hypothetical protein